MARAQLIILLSLSVTLFSKGHVMSPAISPIVSRNIAMEGSEKRPLSRIMKGEEKKKDEKKKGKEDDIGEESELTGKKDKAKKVGTLGCALDKFDGREEMKVNFMYRVEGSFSAMENLENQIEEYEDITSDLLEDNQLINCAVFDDSGESTSSFVSGPGTRRGLRRLAPKIHVVAIDTKPKDKISKDKECNTNSGSTDCEYIEGSLKLILQEDPNTDVSSKKTKQQEELYDATIKIIRIEMGRGTFNGGGLEVTYEGSDDYNGTNVTVVFAEEFTDEAGNPDGVDSSSALAVVGGSSAIVSIMAGSALAIISML